MLILYHRRNKDNVKSKPSSSKAEQNDYNLLPVGTGMGGHKTKGE